MHRTQDEFYRSDSRIIFLNDCCIRRCGLTVNGAVYISITVEGVIRMIVLLMRPLMWAKLVPVHMEETYSETCPVPTWSLRFEVSCGFA